MDLPSYSLSFAPGAPGSKKDFWKETGGDWKEKLGRIIGMPTGQEGPAVATMTETILIVTGVNEVTVRDKGILGGCLALFVHANSGAKKQLPLPWIAKMTAGYVVALFIVGVLYLKA